MRTRPTRKTNASTRRTVQAIARDRELLQGMLRKRYGFARNWDRINGGDR